MASYLIQYQEKLGSDALYKSYSGTFTLDPINAQVYRSNASAENEIRKHIEKDPKGKIWSLVPIKAILLAAPIAIEEPSVTSGFVIKITSSNRVTGKDIVEYYKGRKTEKAGISDFMYKRVKNFRTASVFNREWEALEFRDRMEKEMLKTAIPSSDYSKTIELVDLSKL